MIDDLLTAFRPVYQRTRGSALESVHYGSIAVAEPDGSLVAWYGDPEISTFLRSSAKPLQAIPLVEKGGLQTFGITEQELALICASHSGTPSHLRTLDTLQRKLDITEQDLACGTHLPFHKPSRYQLICEDTDPNQNHHNCSGKHAGMLALAKLSAAPTEGYPEIDHPVQQQILEVIKDMCCLRDGQLLIARDGCSVVTFGMPLKSAALGWARFAAPEDLPTRRKEACQSILTALLTYPAMVAGPERFDTDIMDRTAGRVASKAGAEAFQALGIPPDSCSRWPRGLGIALKISDGDQGKAARAAVALETLKQLGILTPDDLTALSGYGPIQPIRNQRGIRVGEGRPCFQLHFRK